MNKHDTLESDHKLISLKSVEVIGNNRIFPYTFIALIFITCVIIVGYFSQHPTNGYSLQTAKNIPQICIKWWAILTLSLMAVFTIGKILSSLYYKIRDSFYTKKTKLNEIFNNNVKVSFMGKTLPHIVEQNFDDSHINNSSHNVSNEYNLEDVINVHYTKNPLLKAHHSLTYIRNSKIQKIIQKNYGLCYGGKFIPPHNSTYDNDLNIYYYTNENNEVEVLRGKIVLTVPAQTRNIESSQEKEKLKTANIIERPNISEKNKNFINKIIRAFYTIIFSPFNRTTYHFEDVMEKTFSNEMILNFKVLEEDLQRNGRTKDDLENKIPNAFNQNVYTTNSSFDGTKFYNLIITQTILRVSIATTLLSLVSYVIMQLMYHVEFSNYLVPWLNASWGIPSIVLKISLISSIIVMMTIITNFFIMIKGKSRRERPSINIGYGKYISLNDFTSSLSHTYQMHKIGNSLFVKENYPLPIFANIVFTKKNNIQDSKENDTRVNVKKVFPKII